MAIRTELFEIDQLDQLELGRWRELAQRALEPNPFFEPDYLLPLTRGLGCTRQVALAAVVERDEWLACVPVCRGVGWHRLPLRSTSVWPGHDLYSRLGTPLIDATRTRVAAAALVNGLVHNPRSAFTGLEWMVEDGPVFRLVVETASEAGLRSLRWQHSERALLCRRPEGDYLEQAMNSGHRRALRRQWRRLGEHFGEEPQVLHRAGDPDAAAELIEIEALSPIGRLGSPLKADPGHARFFVEMCAAYAAQGRLRLLSLQAGGRTLAMQCEIMAGPGLFGIKTAYDPRYAKFSPGIQLAVRSMQCFHEQTEAEWFDSCADQHNATFNRLWPARRSLVRLAAVEPSLGSLATVSAIRGARFVRDRLDARRARAA